MCDPIQNHIIFLFEIHNAALIGAQTTPCVLVWQKYIFLHLKLVIKILNVHVEL